MSLLYTKEKTDIFALREGFYLNKLSKSTRLPVIKWSRFGLSNITLTHRNARRAHISAHIISGIGKRLPELPALHEITILNRAVKAQTKTKWKHLLLLVSIV